MLCRRPMILLLLVLTFVLLQGCAPEAEHLALPVEGTSHEHDLVGDQGLVFVAEVEALRLSLYDLDMEGVLSPVIALEGRDYDRVGLRFDADRTPDVDVRISSDHGESWSRWFPAPIGFREGLAHNAHADPDAGGTHVQVRFLGINTEELRFLVVEAFVVQRQQDAPPRSDDGLRQQVQELAVHAGADLTRAQWGARAHRCSSSHSPYRVAIHHTVTPTNDSSSVAQRMRQMQSFHMDSRGWCDIGYHFVIGQDGNVYQGRPEGLLGTHVGGANSGNLGVSFIGTYTHSPPSQQMMNAGGRILAAINGHYGIALDRNRVRGHREYGGTACPGEALYARLGDLIAIAQGSPGQGGVNESGCTATQASNCAAFGCHCVDGECNGGFCDGSGCTEQQKANCGAFGCDCVDGQCSGGFCPGSGCTAKQQQDCAGFGCHCVDGQCSGGYCPGPGCTAKQQLDCGAFGCHCVDGECNGGFCPGPGCTAKQQQDCGGFGCHCVDGQCDGGFCPGPGCTAKQQQDCGGFGCTCVDGQCNGGFCEGTGCTARQTLDCSDPGAECTGGMCVQGGEEPTPEPMPQPGGCVPTAFDDAEDDFFADFTDVQWGAAEAAILYRAEITNGCNDSPRMFCPNCPISRQAMVTLLVRAARLDISNPPAEPTFADVAPGSQFYAYVEAAVAAGITTGCGGGNFCPAETVTRQATAAMIRRAANWRQEPVPQTPSFSDVGLDHPFFADIEVINARCVTTGCGEDGFCPAQEVTRRVAAIFVARAFNLEEINPCAAGYEHDPIEEGPDPDAGGSGEDVGGGEEDVGSGVETDVGGSNPGDLDDEVSGDVGTGNQDQGTSAVSTPGGEGCGGCSTGKAEGPVSVLPALLLVLTLLVLRQRRRQWDFT